MNFIKNLIERLSSFIKINILGSNRKNEFSPRGGIKNVYFSQNNNKGLNQAANGNIINEFGSIDIQANEDAISNLIKVFSKSSAQKIIDEIKDPRRKIQIKGEDQIGFVKKKFEQVKKIPNQRKFLDLKNKALAELESFIDSHDENRFRNMWADIAEELSKLFQ